MDAPRRLARLAAAVIDEGDLTSLEGLARSLGVTARHLRRSFQSEFGVSPVAYAQTSRLLMAKRLLTDTRLSLADVAFAAGFGSVRRFNLLFQERYRMPPSRLRHATSEGRDGLQFELSYRPPMHWDGLMQWLEQRAVPGVEEVLGGVYRRTLRNGWMEVSHQAARGSVRVTLSPSLAHQVVRILGRVRRLLYLSCQPDVVAAALGEVAEGRPFQRIPGAMDGFETSCLAVLGQMRSVAGARTLMGRLASTLGPPIDTPYSGLVRLFPTPAEILQAPDEAWEPVGISRARRDTIRYLAAHADLLHPFGDVAGVMRTLQAGPGIGDWTVQKIAMRVLAWPDAFPHTDLHLKRKLGPKAREIAEQWRPWLGYAAMQLWQQDV